MRPGYKQTEVGEIPEDWDVKELMELVHFKNGKAHENDIKEDGKYIVVNSKFISTEGEIKKYSDNCHSATSKDNILMVMSDVPNGKAIAKCFLVDEDDKYTVNQRICSLHLIKDNPKFVFYRINRNPYYLSFDDGVKQTNLRKDDVLKCSIAIPGLVEEQKAIAKTLSDVDELIVSLEKLIAKKRDIKTATIQQLLTGKKRLPGFGEGKGYKQTELGKIPEDWGVVELGNYANFFKGKGLAKSEIRSGGKKKCIHYGELFTQYPEVISNIKSSTNSTFDSFLSMENDVLMPTSDVTPNGLAVASCILENGVILGGDVLVIRLDPKRIIGGYLSYKIRSSKNQIMQLVTGSTVYHLYGSDMARFKFAIPQSVSEQKKIVDTLTDMGAEIDSLGAELEKIKDIKQGMMQELLTGRTRLL